MEGHMEKIKSENDFDSKSFIVESSEARRIFAMNSREEKRLEKVRKNLEKQRAIEEKRLLKDQKDAVIRFFRKRNSGAKVGAFNKLTTGSVSQPRMASQEQLSSRSGNWDAQVDPKNLRADKNYQHNGMHCRRADIGYNHIASNSFSVFPDVQNILASEGNLAQRSRSWSNQERANLRFSHKVGNDSIKGKKPKGSAQPQKSLIHKNFTEEFESETKRKETSLSDVLPPVILPPLHSQKNKTLKEKRRGSLRKKEQVKKEELWDGLEDCRYIRTYLKKK